MGKYAPIIVEGETLGETWEKAVFKMMTEGFDRWVEAPEYRIMTKDNSMFLMVKNPMKEPKLSPLSPTSRKVTEEYAKNLLEGLPSESENQFDYTYYSRLRHYPDCKIRAFIPNVTTDKELKEHVKNISRGKCIVERIDQIQEAINIFKKDPTRRSVVLHTWIPKRDLEKFSPKRKDTSSPCLVLMHPQLVKNKLHMNVVMKTNDLFSAWPGNAFGFTTIQKYIADEVGVEVGNYNHFSISMQIYQDRYEMANKVVEKFTKTK